MLVPNLSWQMIAFRTKEEKAGKTEMGRGCFRTRTVHDEGGVNRKLFLKALLSPFKVTQRCL